MTDRERQLEAMLERCEKQFLFYAEQHMAKLNSGELDPQAVIATTEKATVNRNFALEIERLLRP